MEVLSPKLLAAIQSWCKRKTGQDVVLIAVVLIFFAGMLPLAASRVVDTLNFERYYTDAAVSMLQSQDFFTPRYGDGTLRLHKPLPIYWLLIGSYKLLGVSFFSTRIWFLVVGCATIWVTYLLARKLTGDIRTARTTALILLSNPFLIMVSARSTPDILATFCLLVSAYGFIRLICCNDIHTSAYWSAYGGAAVSIAIRGLLPLVFVIYALVFAYFTSSPQQPFRRVLHAGIILASILIACSGFLVMALKYGALFLQSFWGDQFGEKTGFKGSPLRVSAYLLIYVLLLLPWVLCLACLFYSRKPENPLTTIERKTCLFAVIWAVLLPIIFGLGDRFQERYLLPAIPLLAIVMAIGLCRFSNSTIAVITDQLLNVVTLCFVAIAAFGLSVLWQNEVLTKHFAGFTVLSLTLLLFVLRLQRNQFSSQAVLSISLFLILPLCLAILSPFTLPDQTTQVARALRSLNPEKKAVFVVGTNKLASRLRISSGDEYMIYQAKASDLLKRQPHSSQSIFVFTEGEARHLPASSVRLQEIAAYPIKISLPVLFKETLRNRAKAYIESRKTHCYAVVPDPTALSIP
jgi:4-amino-4-deoxy-L-arabinose transferase-like glycosyltransferase